MKIPHWDYANLRRRIKFLIFEGNGFAFSIGADTQEYIFTFFKTILAFAPTGLKKNCDNYEKN